jgi:hypothetical protein
MALDFRLCSVVALRRRAFWNAAVIGARTFVLPFRTTFFRTLCE